MHQRPFPHWAAAIALLAGSLCLAAPPETNWPQWRGPLCSGVAPKSRPPTTWSATQNIRWKTPIPGRGNATPIVWDDRVYVCTAVEIDGAADAGRPAADAAPAMQDRPQRGRRRRPPPRPTKRTRFEVLALDRKRGKIVWTTKVAEEVPQTAGHPDASLASNSPVTDGQHIYAYFGSRGLHCLDQSGRIKWSREFGQMQTRNDFGEGSSPALHGDTIVVNWDHEGDDFVAALNKHTGKVLWKVPRDEPTSWSTPLVIEFGGKPQVVVSATNYVRSYDLASGDELWRCSGMTTNTIPSPVADRALVYCLSGFRGAALLAIKYGGARGDLADSPAVAWRHDQNTPYVPSPVLYKNTLYFLENNRPILTALDAKSGKPLYQQQRVSGPDMIYASLVAAAGHVYIVGRNGKAVVFREGPQYEVVATPSLNDDFEASPAIAGNELYLRGQHDLYCIAEG